MTSKVPITVLTYPFALRNDVRHFLLLRRVPEAGGFWQGVTGATLEGEELEVAARRELLEETGFSPYYIRALNHSYRIKLQGIHKEFPGGEICEHVFLAEIPEGVPTLDREEHDDWGYFDYETALTLLKWDTNIDALERCEALLGSATSFDRDM